MPHDINKPCGIVTDGGKGKGSIGGDAGNP
jgi:hypothetical protein